MTFSPAGATNGRGGSPGPVAAGRAGRLADAGLVLLVVGAAFALGCQEMVDSDVWWHVRAGRWICENGWVPVRDPFTFASADRAWIDLHWLFQVMLAAAHGAGGARGIILLAAGLCAAVAAAGLAARERRWPAWVAAACWLPALVVMSARFAPRPELLSMLAMAGYLAILTRADDRPVWIWLLPAVQVVWVNAHALFVLGPIILGLYLADRIVGRARRPVAKRDRLHLAGAGAAVLLACLASPYGWRGASLPLELFPKITAWGGTYKAYIIEFMDLREFVARQSVPIAAANLYNRAECFLLWALPVSWIVPSAWRAARRDGAGGSRDPAMGRLAAAGPVAFGLAMGLVLAAAMGLPGQGTPRWMVAMGRMAPVGLAAMGAIAAAIIVRSSRRAAMIAVMGGLAASVWTIWLRAYLFGAEPGPSAWLGVPGRGSVPIAWAAGVLGVAAAALAVVFGGARPFRIALAVAFGYLALQAIRNANLFGLAAGFVLAGDLGEWAAELSAGGPAGSRRTQAPAFAGISARTIVAAAAVLLIAATVSGRLFRATGERRAFGLSASPTAYAHDAARFAGRPGLPEHALVYSLRQAGVYVFHNGPERKVFMDGRLEVPTRETFESYTLLERMMGEGGPGWREALRRIGDPLVLLDHEAHSGAEATLLADPEWRCVYHDPVASIFVSRRRRDLEATFPTVDFLARHFRDPARRAAPSSSTSLAEGRALLGLASALRGRPGVTWGLRASLLLPACDRFRQTTDSGRADAGDWALLGEAVEGLNPDPPSPSPDPWDPARRLLIDQATACYRRALELDPGEKRALFALYRSFGARRMGDARASIATMMRHAWAAAVGGDPDADPGPVRDPNVDPDPADVGPPPGWERDGDGLARAVAELIRRRRPEAAVRLWNEAEARGIAAPWAARDRVALALLDLGRPAEAHGVWLGAADPPSPAFRSARLAAAALAALDFPAARREYRAALDQQPDLGQAWFGLALMHVQLGEADEALAACRAGRKCHLTPPQEAFLGRLERLASGVP